MTRMASKALGHCWGASLCQKGKTLHSTPTGQPRPLLSAPTAPVTSQGFSYSLNTVSHCCTPWQAQIRPSVPGEPCSLSLLSFPTGGGGDRAGRRGEKRAPLFVSQAGTSGHKLTASVRERTPLSHPRDGPTVKTGRLPAAALLPSTTLTPGFLSL